MRDSWTEATLGKVAEWYSGGTPRAGRVEFYQGGQIPWVVIADMANTELHGTATAITPAGLDAIGGRMAPVGSVLISMYATVGRAAFAHIPVATNQAIAWGVPNHELVLARFLLLVAQSLEGAMSSAARGATQRNINRQMLREFEFLLPPINEQKRIVDLVASVDGYIESLQEQVDAARTARNAVLHDLISAGGDDWIETTLGEIAEYVNGYPFKPIELGEEGIPVIRIRQLLDPNESVDRSTVAVPERCVLNDGDVVFSWSGTLAVRVWNRGRAYLNQHLFRVLAKEGVLREWLPVVLGHAIEELSEKTHGTTMKHITKQTLLPHKTLLPPTNEQKRIVDILSSTDEVIAASESALSSAKGLRAGLLAELLSGEHEIPESYDRFLGAA
jgi:restriction endonuclease S subunit